MSSAPVQNGECLHRIGPKHTLLWVLASWTGGLLLLGLVLDKVPFLIAGAVLGSGLGGVAVTDRLLLLRLARPEQVGEMLGLYGLAGKFSAVIGPIAYGSIVGLLLGPLGKVAYQIAILSLLVLMVIGFLIVRKVPDGTPHPVQELQHPSVEPAIVPPGEVP